MEHTAPVVTGRRAGSGRLSLKFSCPYSPPTILTSKPYQEHMLKQIVKYLLDKVTARHMHALNVRCRQQQVPTLSIATLCSQTADADFVTRRRWSQQMARLYVRLRNHSKTASCCVSMQTATACLLTAISTLAFRIEGAACDHLMTTLS